MVYQGSKSKIKKYILPIILKDRTPGQWYVEPFVGGCNSICDVENPRIGGDTNNYLIAMWKGLQGGMDVPMNIDKDMYNRERTLYNTTSSANLALTGYIGFHGSYGGRFFEGGYANSEGSRNHSVEKHRNTIKQLPMLQGVVFEHCSFDTLTIPDNSIIYCDIPYRNTKGYTEGGKFNYTAFYNWCMDRHADGHTIYISEYNMPCDYFEEVWSKEVPVMMSQGISTASTEKLFRVRDTPTGESLLRRRILYARAIS